MVTASSFTAMRGQRGVKAIEATSSEAALAMCHKKLSAHATACCISGATSPDNSIYE